jgi:hypothetical protein
VPSFPKLRVGNFPGLCYYLPAFVALVIPFDTVQRLQGNALWPFFVYPGTPSGVAGFIGSRTIRGRLETQIASIYEVTGQ